MQLHALLRRLDRAGVAAEERRGPTGSTEDLAIDHLADDSRAVGPGGLFVALRGTQSDGHLFIDKAAENGAVAVVCEEVPGEAPGRFPGVVFVRVSDTRVALAELAAAFYGDPACELRMVGITGTNGKTTTAFLVHHLLTALGEKTGLLGTIEVRLGGSTAPASLTTPGPIELHRLLREMVGSGCTACAMEVSSHALVQERVRAVAYDVGIFTNLSPEHLDYHGAMAGYRAAKKRLFDGLPPEATALYNADDEAGPQVVADTAARVVSFGQSDAANVRVEVLENRLDGLRLRIDGSERAFRLVGSFNAYNLVAAYGAGRTLGYEQDDVLEALAEAPPVPGRFEQMRFAGGTTVIVDYAHTPDALEKTLQAARATREAGAALWCVFGCGGDRDREKRPRMGRVAERYADHVVVTSDNPRTEDPERIMGDIRRGMERPCEALWIAGRRAAIRAAARRARPGDVVLVAGKGHETYQIVGTEKRPFDDREVVKRFFASRR